MYLTSNTEKEGGSLEREGQKPGEALGKGIIGGGRKVSRGWPNATPTGTAGRPPWHGEHGWGGANCPPREGPAFVTQKQMQTNRRPRQKKWSTGHQRRGAKSRGRTLTVLWASQKSACKKKWEPN